MRPQPIAVRAVLALMALGVPFLAGQPAAAAEEYSPLNSPSTYTKPGEAPAHQA
ncbi:MAG: hypothetical protein HY794_10995, partial [Desulfarculus sp.]|nr:hypothetical protein [Desulfarculus sp.]